MLDPGSRATLAPGKRASSRVGMKLRMLAIEGWRAEEPSLFEEMA